MSTSQFIGEVSQCVSIFALWWTQFKIFDALERAGIKL